MQEAIRFLRCAAALLLFDARPMAVNNRFISGTIAPSRSVLSYLRSSALGDGSRSQYGPAACNQCRSPAFRGVPRRNTFVTPRRAFTSDSRQFSGSKVRDGRHLPSITASTSSGTPYTSPRTKNITDPISHFSSSPNASDPEQHAGSIQQASHGSTRLSRPENIIASAAPQQSTIPQSSSSPLPSESRTDLIFRLQQLTDRLLARVSTLSQQLNIYTGTDYTGISNLRSEIAGQEHHVRETQNGVTAAKQAHSDALAAQSASQKEVVQLLERKHSWSATDLERYMSLIRSEHVNEQAVTSARDKVREQERELEDGRQKLERLERKQYHEEQIWSDTIRRNSTWVTFGLMGVNILLLLGNVVVIEPWRRSRLVKEFKTAIDEKVDVPAAAATAIIQAREAAVIGKASTSESVVSEDTRAAEKLVPSSEPPTSLPNLTQPAAVAGSGMERAQEVDAVEIAVSRDGTGALRVPETAKVASLGTALEMRWWGERTWSDTMSVLRARVADVPKRFNDLFSDSRLTLRKVDVTMTAIQSAAAGAAVGAAVAWMFRLLLETK